MSLDVRLVVPSPKINLILAGAFPKVNSLAVVSLFTITVLASVTAVAQIVLFPFTEEAVEAFLLYSNTSMAILSSVGK